MTYDEFISLIKSYTIRDDAPIDGFIVRAESSLRPLARHYLSEKAAVLTPVGNAVSLPADFLEFRQLTGDTQLYRPITPVMAETVEGQCGYYRQGNQIVFVGTPDATVTLLYQASFSGISSSSSNWLFDRFPQVYVASVLKEFHRWTQNPEGMQLENQALQEALATVAADDQRGRVLGTLTIGERYPSW